MNVYRIWMRMNETNEGRIDGREEGGLIDGSWTTWIDMTWMVKEG